MSTQPATGCDACNKSSLSLLLLRPSPIAKNEPALMPPGAASVSASEGALAGLVPATALKESRYALRLVRAGYVHVYVPSPPPGMKNWLIYHVTDNADLIEHKSLISLQSPVPLKCSAKGHNESGMRLLRIPQAHKVGVIWIAYSANLWNDTLRAKNQANPQVMQQVNLAGGSAHTFKPSVEALKSQVLECALPSLVVGKARDHDFPFVSLQSMVESLANQLTSAAACHPMTAGKELAVVLRDPVGVATELNAIRLRRHELAKRDMEKPTIAHPLNSANALMGLKKVMLDRNLAKSMDTVSPLMSQGAFEDTMRLRPNPRGWPAGTQWEPLPATRENAALGLKMGRVVFPDHQARAEAWAKMQTEATWQTMSSRYDEPARVRWMAEFETDMKRRHYEPLEAFEQDWRTAADDTLTLAYFRQHFDAAHANDPLRSDGAGQVYAGENQLINQPAPLTTGAVLDAYLALLDKPITDEAALVQRALVGNQSTLFAAVQALLNETHRIATGDPGLDEKEGGGLRDKAYDLVKGLRGESAMLKKFSWLGDALCAASVGQLSALSAAALSVAARHGGGAQIAHQALAKLQGLWVVQRTLDHALQHIVHGQALALPVLVKRRLPVHEAMLLLRERIAEGAGGPTRKQVASAARQGLVELSVLTDTQTLAKLDGNVDAVIAQGAGRVDTRPSSTPAVLKPALAAGTLFISDVHFERAWRTQARSGANAAAALRDLLGKLGASASAQQARSITLTIDGRLAVGSIIVQGIGLYNSVQALKDAQTQKQVRDAWYGIYDGSAGVMGGLLETWAVAVQAGALAQGGNQAAMQSAKLAGLRAAANFAGAAGGLVNAVGAWAKAKDARIEGNSEVATFLNLSGYAFIGTAGTSTLTAFGIGADWVVARQIGGTAMQEGASAVAKRFGAHTALRVMTLSVSGWGLVLLGAGLMFQVGAAVLTPTPLQKWAGRSYFGRRDDKFPKGDWQTEHKALMEALQGAAKPTEDEQPLVQMSDIAAP